MPGNSRERVLGIARGMEEAGLGVVIEVGWPGRPLFDIPVSEGRLGVVVMGGLNPVAILEETGMRVRQTGALAGLVDYRKLIPYDQMAERAARRFACAASTRACAAAMLSIRSARGGSRLRWPHAASRSRSSEVARYLQGPVRLPFQT